MTTVVYVVPLHSIIVCCLFCTPLWFYQKLSNIQFCLESNRMQVEPHVKATQLNQTNVWNDIIKDEFLCKTILPFYRTQQTITRSVSKTFFQYHVKLHVYYWAVNHACVCIWVALDCKLEFIHVELIPRSLSRCTINVALTFLWAELSCWLTSQNTACYTTENGS